MSQTETVAKKGANGNMNDHLPFKPPYWPGEGKSGTRGNREIGKSGREPDFLSLIGCFQKHVFWLSSPWYEIRDDATTFGLMSRSESGDWWSKRALSHQEDMLFLERQETLFWSKDKIWPSQWSLGFGSRCGLQLCPTCKIAKKKMEHEN